MPFTVAWMALEIAMLSKSGREREMSYDATCIWNLRKYTIEPYLQNRNRLTDFEKEIMIASEEGAGQVELDWQFNRDMNTMYRKIH